MDCLEQAIQVYGVPEIFNMDQGCQFTSTVFTDVLKGHRIAINIDGRGRELDHIFVERLWRSVKHESLYSKGYATMPELLLGLKEYFEFLQHGKSAPVARLQHPDEVYRAACGGGASIVDK